MYLLGLQHKPDEVQFISEIISHYRERTGLTVTQLGHYLAKHWDLASFTGYDFMYDMEIRGNSDIKLRESINHDPKTNVQRLSDILASIKVSREHRRLAKVCIKAINPNLELPKSKVKPLEKLV
jgi:hypothetical protein